MQAGTFDGTFDQLFLWIFSWNFTEDASQRLLYHGAKKSKMTKNSNHGVLPYRKKVEIKNRPFSEFPAERSPCLSWSIIVGDMDSLFLFLFFSFLTMAPHVLERKIALIFTYRKIAIIFKSVELEHTPSCFPQSKSWPATVRCPKKKKKGQPSWDNSCFFAHNHCDGITTPKTTREGQESTTKTIFNLIVFVVVHFVVIYFYAFILEERKKKKLNKIEFNLTSKVQEPSAFHSESSKQVPLLGLLLISIYAVAACRNLEACLAAWKLSSPNYARAQRSGLLLRGLLWRG